MINAKAIRIQPLLTSSWLIGIKFYPKPKKLPQIYNPLASILIIHRIVPSMVEKFPVEVVPLKFVSVSSQDITAFGFLKTGWTMQSTYAETPHRYMVDSIDVLLPKYMGESKQTRWVTGWVHSKTLINKYPEDPFIQQCSQLDAGGDPREKIACLIEIEGEKAIIVRVVTPVKIKIHGLLHQHAQLHQV
jgi:hypothetical protein